MSEFEAGVSAQVMKAADEVKMVIDEVRDIAHKTMGNLTDKAGHHKSSFGHAAKVDHAAFGQVAKAQAFAAHQEAARQVFVDTYQGVIEDLESFRANLLACADAHQANDESVQAGLLALSHRLGSQTLAANRDNLNSRRDHEKQLAPGPHEDEHHDGTPGDPSAPAATTAPPTTAPTADVAPTGAATPSHLS